MSLSQIPKHFLPTNYCNGSLLTVDLSQLTQLADPHHAGTPTNSGSPRMNTPRMGRFDQVALLLLFRSSTEQKCPVKVVPVALMAPKK